MSNTKQSMLKNITPSQIKKIHALVADVGLSDDVYRETLWLSYKVKSSKDLLNFQANELIDKLVRFLTENRFLIDQAAGKYKALNGRPGFANAAQLTLIESIWDVVSRMETPELKAKALRRFIYKIAGVSDLRFLSKSGAGKVIIALRSMERN